MKVQFIKSKRHGEKNGKGDQLYDFKVVIKDAINRPDKTTGYAIRTRNPPKLDMANLTMPIHEDGETIEIKAHQKYVDYTMEITIKQIIKALKSWKEQ